MANSNEGTASPLRPGEIAAAMEWWRTAGVDLDFLDEPVMWLAVPEPAAPALPAGFMAAPDPARQTPGQSAQAAPGQAIGGPPESWPRSLGDFAPWWMNEPSLDNGAVRGRVPPRGAAGAEAMLIVAQPEATDEDTLLSGPHGSLAAAILAALGIAPEQAYFASALPRHIPAADWDMLAAQGLGQVLRHHVALAAPRRILTFGAVVPSLLGHDPAQISGITRNFKHEERSTALLAARELAYLAAKPMAKARLWQRLLDFTGPGLVAPEHDRTGTV